MKQVRWLVLCALVALVGCESKSDDAEKSEKAESEASEGAGESGASGATNAGTYTEKDTTMDCPTHVMSTTNAIETLPDGYAVVITTDSESDLGSIREYAAYLAAARSFADPPSDALNFGDNTRNRNNQCPIELDGTTVTAKDIPGGVRVEVRPDDPAALAAIVASAQEDVTTIEVMRAAMKEAMPPPP